MTYKSFLNGMSIILFLSFWANAAEVSRAKAAESTIHRIETLVITNPPKNIEVGFRDHFHRLRVDVLDRQSTVDPKYYIFVEQYPCQDSSVNQVEFWFNPDGTGTSKWKVKATAGNGPAHEPPQWPIENKDALTLAEPAIHYVIDNVLPNDKGEPLKPELVPYDQGLKTLEIRPVLRESGELVAQIDIETMDETAPTLRVFVKVDGTFDSAQFVVKPPVVEPPVVEPPVEKPPVVEPPTVKPPDDPK